MSLAIGENRGTASSSRGARLARLRASEFVRGYSLMSPTMALMLAMLVAPLIALVLL